MIEIPVNENGEIIGDQVFATMVATMLPVGLRGLVVGGMLAALMSSLSSLFNSSASLFTLDVYKKVKPQATEQQLVTVGRIATLTIVVLGMLWIPIMHRLAGNEGLYKYLQSVQGYLAPPITAVFLLGLFYARTNSAGAIAGLAIGFILGMGKLTIETFYGSSKLTQPTGLAFIGDINFTYMSGILFAIVVGLVLAVSHLTAAPNEERIRGLTYDSIDKAEVRRSWNAFDVIATVIVLGLTFGVYAYFSFWI